MTAIAIITSVISTTHSRCRILLPRPHIRRNSPEPDFFTSPKQPQTQWGDSTDQGNDCLEDQHALHVPRRVTLGSLLEGITNQDEATAKQLATGPSERGSDLWADGVGELDEQLEGDGEQGEGCGAQDGEDDVRTGDSPLGSRLGHPDEDEVGQGDEGDADLDAQHKGLCAVDDGARDGGRDQADYDEHRGADPRVVLGVAMGHHHLGQEGRYGVEQSDVDGERYHDHPGFGGARDDAQRRDQSLLGRFARGCNGGRGRCRDEETGDRTYRGL